MLIENTEDRLILELVRDGMGCDGKGVRDEKNRSERVPISQYLMRVFANLIKICLCFAKSSVSDPDPDGSGFFRRSESGF